MFTQKQFVVRKRRSDLEQLSHSEYYSEFIGMKSTGRIVDSKGNFIAMEKEYRNIPEKEVIPAEPISSTESKETFEEIESIKTIEMKSSRVLIVEHQCGSSLVDCENDSEINFEEYKKEIENKYWEGFVISINYLGE